MNNLENMMVMVNLEQDAIWTISKEMPYGKSRELESVINLETQIVDNLETSHYGQSREAYNMDSLDKYLWSVSNKVNGQSRA